MNVVIYFICLPQICTKKSKMHDFNFDFSKIFWGGAHQASPQSPPSFFSGFALGSGFASLINDIYTSRLRLDPGLIGLEN